jgi:hypothetical protein
MYFGDELWERTYVIKRDKMLKDESRVAGRESINSPIKWVP